MKTERENTKKTEQNTNLFKELTREEEEKRHRNILHMNKKRFE